MRIYQQQPVVEHLYRQGDRLAKGVNSAIAENGLQDYFQLAGKPSNLNYMTRDQDENRSQAFRTFLGMLSLIAPRCEFFHTDHIDKPLKRSANPECHRKRWSREKNTSWVARKTGISAIQLVLSRAKKPRARIFF
jgi:hypothetical protein